MCGISLRSEATWLKPSSLESATESLSFLSTYSFHSFILFRGVFVLVCDMTIDDIEQSLASILDQLKALIE